MTKRFPLDFRAMMEKAGANGRRPLVSMLALLSLDSEQPDAPGPDESVEITTSEVNPECRLDLIQTEAGHLQPNDLHLNRIPEALAELRVVVEMAEKAADDILHNAEAMMAGESGDEDIQTTLENYGMLLVEACTFQDLLGQRVSRVVESLEHIERRLNRFTSNTGVVDTAHAQFKGEDEAEQRREEQILFGPQNANEATSQADIDALFD